MIKFTGGMDTAAILRDNPGARSYAASLAMMIDGQITVHVEPRNEFGILEWLIRISSPKGLRSFQIRQLMPLGAINELKN